MKGPKFFAQFVLLASLAMLTSCAGVFDKRLKEGRIEYDVSYPDADPDDIFAGLKPDKLSMYFKDDVYMAEMSGGMGTFRTSFISDSKKHELINTVKLFGKKYAIILDDKGVNELNAPFEDHSIVFLEETKVIAGLTCKKAIVLFDDPDMGEIYVYYTDEIRINQPNWSTPFKGIEGVMLEYEISRYGMRMKFTAAEIISEEVDPELLHLPEGYKKVSPAVFDEEITTIMDSFQ